MIEGPLFFLFLFLFPFFPSLISYYFYISQYLYQADPNTTTRNNLCSSAPDPTSYLRPSPSPPFKPLLSRFYHPPTFTTRHPSILPTHGCPHPQSYDLTTRLHPPSNIKATKPPIHRSRVSKNLLPNHDPKIHPPFFSLFLMRKIQ